MKVADSGRSAAGFGRELRFAAALLLALTACPGQPGDEREAKSAVAAFYDVYLKLHPSGVPSRDEQVQFKKVISSDLAGLLDQASVAEENYSKATKGESPPMIEGDLFTSLFEGAESYKVLQCESQKDSGACTVELTHVDERDKSKVTWKDRIFVVREQSRWAVDDIEFLGDWQFMHKGRLKDILKQVIEEGKKPTG